MKLSSYKTLKSFLESEKVRVIQTYREEIREYPSLATEMGIKGMPYLGGGYFQLKESFKEGSTIKRIPREFLSYGWFRFIHGGENYYDSRSGESVDLNHFILNVISLEEICRSLNLTISSVNNPGFLYDPREEMGNHNSIYEIFQFSGPGPYKVGEVQIYEGGSAWMVLSGRDLSKLKYPSVYSRGYSAMKYPLKTVSSMFIFLGLKNSEVNHHWFIISSLLSFSVVLGVFSTSLNTWGALILIILGSLYLTLKLAGNSLAVYRGDSYLHLGLISQKTLKDFKHFYKNKGFKNL